MEKRRESVGVKRRLGSEGVSSAVFLMHKSASRDQSMMFFRKMMPRLLSVIYSIKTDNIANVTRGSVERAKDAKRWVNFSNAFCRLTTSPEVFLQWDGGMQ